MSESRYAAGLTDPDETTRIPGEALEGLRDTDAGRDAAAAAAADGSRNGSPASGPAGSPAAAESAGGPVGESGGFGSATMSPRVPSPGLNGYPSDGAPAASSAGAANRPSVFGSGSTSVGSLPADSGSAAGSGSTAASGFAGSGYAERTGNAYSSSPYSGSYGGAYPSLGEPPTAVTGPAGGVGAGGARTALGAAAGVGGATTIRPVPVGARPSARSTTASRPPRRARLLVRHIDPWSTLKFSFVLAVAMFFVWLVAVGVLYGVLDGMGVFEQLNSLYGEVSGSTGDQLFSPGLVLGTAALIGAVNIVLFTALATIGAFVYNICSDLVGGIEVTLAERD